MQTIFQRFGGFPQVSKVISTFYDRLLDTPELAVYFEGTDMRRLIDHQAKFISSVMGGPASYSDEHLRHVHERMGITSAAFDEATLILRECLEDHDMEESDIGEVMTAVQAKRPVIVSA